MTPTTAILVTALAALANLLAGPTTQDLAAFALVISVCLAIVANSLQPLRLLMIWTVAFLLPLLLIHGLLNTQFPVEFRYAGLDVRPLGIEYAGRTSAFLASFFAAALCWLWVPRDQLLSFLVACGMPSLLLSVAFQALSLVGQIEVRANAIALAQRARGIDTEGGLLTRVRALVPIVLPLTVALLKEASSRAAVQDFICVQQAIRVPGRERLSSFLEFVLVAAAIALLVLIHETLRA